MSCVAFRFKIVKQHTAQNEIVYFIRRLVYCACACVCPDAYVFVFLLGLCLCLCLFMRSSKPALYSHGAVYFTIV